LTVGSNSGSSSLDRAAIPVTRNKDYETLNHDTTHAPLSSPESGIDSVGGAAIEQSPPRLLRRFALFTAASAGLLFTLGALASTDVFLTVSQPKKSDVILALGGDEFEARFNEGLKLLAMGYAHALIVDADASETWWGSTEADLVRNYAENSRSFIFTNPGLSRHGQFH